MTAFGSEHGHADTPPPVQRTEQRFSGHLDIGEEDFVKFGFPSHLFERANVNTGQTHVQKEETDAFMFGCILIGARHQNSPVAVSPARTPNFLAVDDETITITFGLSAQ
ncbi:unannotated protein [freshwater metagenome]|uniref:Unannotated protein n=1 Tax=freshwater metagenome TaxID=449393 RepID=A0A6J6WQE4_9ZZZZ